MKQLPPASCEQLKVAKDPARLLAIEAGPGTGKTLTAAERYGRLIFDPSIQPHRGVTVLSFTVVATSVIQRAIRRRWGANSLAWPNQACTFDSVFRSVLNFLLRTGEIEWPKQHFDIRPIDDWQDLSAAVAQNPQRWVPILKDRKVACESRPTTAGRFVVTAKKRLLPQLEEGMCTHESIRELVLAASISRQLRPRIVSYLANTASSVLVDEAFDSNETDIELLKLFEEAGCSISVVGDPWQAIYGFREVAQEVELDKPVLLGSQLLTPLGFTQLALTESFRFDESLSPLIAKLRRSERVDLSGVDDPDVVLAPEWEQLWEAGPTVIPFAFGQVRSKFDALLTILLDVVLRKNGFAGARLAGTAFTVLGVEKEIVRVSATHAFAPVLDLLEHGGGEAPVTALEMLSKIPKEAFGYSKKLSVGQREREKHTPKLERLGSRLRFGGELIPGMSVHQAKGDEWKRVAVVLTSDDEAALRTGLRQASPRHRLIYVALTRAKAAVGTFEP
jgi:DNA helicase II / ATP-dependent DNA helicase PcrA